MTPLSDSADLKVHEWTAIIVLTAVLSALALLASGFGLGLHSQDQPRSSAFRQKVEKIEILVKGAVAYPGIYCLPSGVTMGELFLLVEPLAQADLRRFNPEVCFKKGRIVNIALRSMITVNVKGAVKCSGDVFVPKGTRLIDLPLFIELSEDADVESLNRKRKLKEGERVFISKKLQAGDKVQQLLNKEKGF